MNKAFEKILERLDEYEYSNLIEHNSEQCEHCKSIDCEIGTDCTICVMEKAKEIVREVAEEYKDGWIPCSDRLPDESLNSVIGWDAYRDRCVFVQYIQGKFQNMGIDDSFDIIAWQPLPESYQSKGE